LRVCSGIREFDATRGLARASICRSAAIGYGVLFTLDKADAQPRGGTTDEDRSHWVDPFDEMSDEEFDAHVDKLLAVRPATVAVSLRMAPELLGRVKREAGRAGVPYQTFMKGILEAGLSSLERRGLRPIRARPRRGGTRRSV